ncbi:uncharacterized protein LOC129231173 [Uloborus diversus]|uniref:uncharacterized protein LOC129231173 n=1 Tax=Uloborus diversus TaxID=327109 RepID=UPI00240A0A5D|nr:uncharacterized protein LOC129231173 [Uloborus diversus]
MMFDPRLIKLEKCEKEDKATTHHEQQIDNVNGDTDKRNAEEFAPYEKKYFALLQRCEIIKQSNERLVNRIYYVKKLLRRRKKERKFLMQRLDGYGDDYRAIAATLFSEVIGDTSPVRNLNSDSLQISSQIDGDS